MVWLQTDLSSITEGRQPRSEGLFIAVNRFFRSFTCGTHFMALHSCTSLQRLTDCGVLVRNTSFVYLFAVQMDAVRWVRSELTGSLTQTAEQITDAANLTQSKSTDEVKLMQTGRRTDHNLCRKSPRMT